MPLTTRPSDTSRQGITRTATVTPPVYEPRRTLEPGDQDATGPRAEAKPPWCTITTWTDLLSARPADIGRDERRPPWPPLYPPVPIWTGSAATPGNCSGRCAPATPRPSSLPRPIIPPVH